jgi:hypothetical protein
MKILALEHELPGATAGDFQRLAAGEALRVWELYQAGVIRELDFRQDRTAAVLMLECADVTEAEASLATLPFVKEGLITFDIIPLAPYPGFARLFTAQPDPV